MSEWSSDTRENSTGENGYPHCRHSLVAKHKEQLLEYCFYTMVLWAKVTGSEASVITEYIRQAYLGLKCSLNQYYQYL